MVDTPTKLFFPLRSNVWWFQNQHFRDQIIRKIKLSILTFDELLFEDGTFEATFLESGSQHVYFPPGIIQDNQRVIDFQTDIKQTSFSLAVGPSGGSSLHTLMGGETKYRFKIDYFDVFRNIDLGSCPFIITKPINDKNFPDEAKQWISKTEREDSKLLGDIQGDADVARFSIKNLNRDLMASMLTGSAISLDEKHREILLQKSLRSNKLKPSIVKDEAVASTILNFVIPDIDSMPMEKVIETRNDDSWIEFRSLVRKISAQICEFPTMLVDEHDISSQIQGSFFRELLYELERKTPNGRKCSFDMFLGVAGFLPVVGSITSAYSCAKSAYDYFENRNSWVAFLMKVRE